MGSPKMITVPTTKTTTPRSWRPGVWLATSIRSFGVLWLLLVSFRSLIWFQLQPHCTSSTWFLTCRSRPIYTRHTLSTRSLFLREAGRAGSCWDLLWSSRWSTSQHRSKVELMPSISWWKAHSTPTVIYTPRSSTSWIGSSMSHVSTTMSMATQ